MSGFKPFPERLEERVVLRLLDKQAERKLDLSHLE